MFSRSSLAACRALSKAPRAHLARSLATATAEAGESSVSASRPPPARVTIKKRGDGTVVQTGIILNRSPVITRTPTAFERAFYEYQARIERALHNPIPTEFYFKPGSLLEGVFDREENARERETFSPYGARVRKPKSEDEDADALLPGQEEPPELMPRVTEADKKNDVTSLNRKLQRNLYLLLLSKDAAGKDVWRFPQATLGKEEVLHEAAQRELRSSYGLGMDTWVVSRKPIGVYRPPNPASSTTEPSSQPYLFFFKAHILAGQVRPDGKNALDFAWLTKEEIQTRVDEGYWGGVKDMLSDF